MKKIAYLLVLLLLSSVSCKNSSKNKDQTPVANKPLDEIAPDATFYDIKTIFDVIESDPNYNSVMKLANIAVMIDTLKTLRDVTLFAPTNAAINRLPDEKYAELKLPQNLNKLQEILKYHIVQGERDIATIVSTLKAKETPLRLKTLQGAYISLTIDANDNILITDENSNTTAIIEPDIEASNGVIHGISHLLIPQ